jgi:hypothetical protein
MHGQQEGKTVLMVNSGMTGGMIPDDVNAPSAQIGGRVRVPVGLNSGIGRVVILPCRNPSPTPWMSGWLHWK